MRNEDPMQVPSLRASSPAALVVLGDVEQLYLLEWPARPAAGHQLLKRCFVYSAWQLEHVNRTFQGNQSNWGTLT